MLYVISSKKRRLVSTNIGNTYQPNNSDPENHVQHACRFATVNSRDSASYKNSAGEKPRGDTLAVYFRLFSLKFAKNTIDKCG